MSSIHWPAVNFAHIIKFILSVSRADTNTSQQALKGRRSHFAAEKLFTNVSAKYDLVGLNVIIYEGFYQDNCYVLYLDDNVWK